jgi:hypothetical protein
MTTKSQTREYRIWSGMRGRCNNKNAPSYRYYGARGIKVCARWERSFDNFLGDMGVAPSKSHSIDRINNDGNYEPGNCRWATRRQQMTNTSRTVHITIDGVTRSLIEWAEHLELPYHRLQGRLRAGCSIEDLLLPSRQLFKEQFTKRAHCCNGHPFKDESAFFINRVGTRVCRICDSASKRRWDKKSRALKRAA